MQAYTKQFDLNCGDLLGGSALAYTCLSLTIHIDAYILEIFGQHENFKLSNKICETLIVVKLPLNQRLADPVIALRDYLEHFLPSGISERRFGKSGSMFRALRLKV